MLLAVEWWYWPLMIGLLVAAVGGFMYVRNKQG
ncbi:MAG: LPXTG cell wall anchor domain-containing protein [Planctomycetes bacterium]|nr:LPXTG cell wall anchor domain-containing protein [Planctomycetota bacterium]